MHVLDRMHIDIPIAVNLDFVRITGIKYHCMSAIYPFTETDLVSFESFEDVARKILIS